MIIDFHTHIFPPWIINKREEVIACDPLFAELYSNPKARLTNVEDLIAEMDKQEIAISVVLNIDWSSHELCRDTNAYIMESVARYPDRLIGFGMVKLDQPETAVKEIERCLKGGIRGIGEIRPSREIFKNTKFLEPVIQKIIDGNLILLTHSSEPLGHHYPGKGDITPEIIFALVAGFPELKLVCAHWGGGLPFYAMMPEVKKALNHVYFDSAASPYLYLPQVYAQVSQMAGGNKILFGSDYPLLSPGRLLKEITDLHLPESDMENILSGNASGLLGMGAG
jgi:predicted TIM-barrel fold metal-dependent hydrolase